MARTNRSLRLAACLLAILSMFTVLTLQARDAHAQPAPAAAAADDEDVNVKGAFDADDGVGR